MSLLEKLSNILEEDVTVDTVLGEVEAYDSLAILSIVALADKEYGKTLKAVDLANIKTVKELISLIEG